MSLFLIILMNLMHNMSILVFLPGILFISFNKSFDGFIDTIEAVLKNILLFLGIMI